MKGGLPALQHFDLLGIFPFPVEGLAHAPARSGNLLGLAPR